jgi:hypothetical protein
LLRSTGRACASCFAGANSASALSLLLRWQLARSHGHRSSCRYSYMRHGGRAVPGPREVNAREPMPSWLLGRRSKASEWCAYNVCQRSSARNSCLALCRTLPVRYGAPLNQTAPTAAALRRLASVYIAERYLLSIAPGDDLLTDAASPAPRRRRRTAINVSVSEDATAHDALMVMLQAARLQV